MGKIYKFILLMFLAIPCATKAQEGKVEVIEEPEITTEHQRRLLAQDSVQIPGFRIQIYFGSDMYKADEIKEKISLEHPELANQVYRRYERPYWKIRVGNYYREIDAQPLLKELELTYEAVFIVKENIELPPLNIALPSE